MEETYTKETLVCRIADIFGLQRRLAAEVVNEVWVTVLDALAQKKDVVYPGFGRFARWRTRGAVQDTIKLFPHQFAFDVINGRPCKEDTFHKEDQRLKRTGVIEEDVESVQFTQYKTIEKLKGLLQELCEGRNDPGAWDEAWELVRRGK